MRVFTSEVQDATRLHYPEVIEIAAKLVREGHCQSGVDALVLMAGKDFDTAEECMVYYYETYFKVEEDNDDPDATEPQSNELIRRQAFG